MNARQHAVADLDLAHGAGVAAVDARLAGQDLAANDLGFDVEQHVVDLDLVDGGAFGSECRHDGRRGFARGLCAGLLGADLVGRTQLFFGQRADLADEGVVLGGRGPIPGRLAGITHQLVDGRDGHVALLMAEHDAAELTSSLSCLLGFHLRQTLAHATPCPSRIEQKGLDGVQHVLPLI